MAELQIRRAFLVGFRGRISRLLEQYDITSKYYLFLVLRKISINQQITLLDKQIKELLCVK